MTQGCSGPHTGGISRVSAETCCAISWPELSRPTPRICAPFVRIRHRQTKPAAAPRHAAQLTLRPLPTVASLLWTCVQCVERARYGPAHPNGASSGGAFGFWRLSAREGSRRLGVFRDGGRFMGVNSTQPSCRSGRWRGGSRAVGRSDATCLFRRNGEDAERNAAPFLPHF